MKTTAEPAMVYMHSLHFITLWPCPLPFDLESFSFRARIDRHKLTDATEGPTYATAITGVGNYYTIMYVNVAAMTKFDARKWK